MEIHGLRFLDENPKCELKKNTLFLKRKIEGLGRIHRRYDLRCPWGKGRAYIINDKIRTHFQKVFIAFNGDTIVALEPFKFEEPVKYMAPKKWLDFFFLNKKANIKGIDTISGATLTTESIKRAVLKAWKLEANE